MTDLEVENIRKSILNTLNARVAEFHNSAALITYEVVVLPIGVGPFVFGLISPELMFDYERTVEQQFKGVIDRCPADTAPGLQHANVQLVGIEVIGRRVDLFKDGKTLRCLALPALPQVVLKEVPHLVELGRR